MGVALDISAMSLATDDMSRRVVRVLLIADRNVWVAQCIDFDLAAQGESPREAMETFKRLFEMQIDIDRKAGKPPLEEIPSPPHWYEERFNEAWLCGQDNDGPKIPPPFMLKARVSEKSCPQS